MQSVVDPEVARALVDQATEPLKRALRDAELRMADMERRLSQSPGPAPVVVAAPPQGYPATESAATAAAAAALGPMRAPYASAIAPPPGSYRPRAPSALEIEAIIRDVPMDADILAFDGRRRRRTMIILFVVAVLLIFGGMFAMLAMSYAHHGPT
jgi:hypothetical protein